MNLLKTKKYSILINFLRYGFVLVLVFAFLFQGIFLNNITKTASAAVGVFTITTEDASNITINDATMSLSWSWPGAANLTLGKKLPSPTLIWFEYGTTNSKLTSKTPTTDIGGDYNTDGQLNLSLDSSLIPNTLYYYRAVGTANGVTSYGVIKSFITDNTPPVITTGVASNIGINSVTLSGNWYDSYNPSISVGFKYGTVPDITYWKKSTTTSSNLMKGVINNNITQLTANTTYYYQACGTYGSYTYCGDTNSFKTLIGSSVSSPKITSFTPLFGKAGDVIEIDGTNLENANSVIFNGIETTTLTSYGAEKITVTVPEGALSGKITVKSTLLPNAISPNDFTVKGNTNTTTTLVTSNITSNSVTITATGLTAGSTYRINIFNGSNVLKSNWDLNSVSSSTIVTTSPSTSPLSADTSYTIKLSDGTKYLASVNFNTLPESGAGATNNTPPTDQPPSNPGTNAGSNNSGIITNSSVKFSGLVPICNTKVNTTGGFDDPCDFNMLLASVNNIINFVLVILATPLFALIIIYVAWLYLSDMGSSENITKAKKILKNALIGYVIALVAWLVVKTILASVGFNPKDAFLTI